MKQSGDSNRKIAKILGIDRKTVNDYSSRINQSNQDFGALLNLEDGQLLELLGRSAEPVQTDPKRLYFEQQLPNFLDRLGKRKMTRMVLWEDYRVLPY